MKLSPALLAAVVAGIASTPVLANQDLAQKKNLSLIHI